VVDIYDENYDVADFVDGKCEPYRGLVCYRYIGRRQVFVRSDEEQIDVESRLHGESLHSLTVADYPLGRVGSYNFNVKKMPIPAVPVMNIALLKIDDMWKFGLEASMSEFNCSPLQVTDSSRVCLPLNFDSEFSSPLLGAAPAS